MNFNIRDKVLFNSFLYYHHKLDYFAKNENDFWRFKFGLGLGFDIAGYRRQYGHYKNFTLSAGFGYDKIFDYVFNKWQTKKWLPSYTLMLSVNM